MPKKQWTPSMMGKKGGRSRSPEKLAALKINASKPRPGARKDKRQPEARPKGKARAGKASLKSQP